MRVWRRGCGRERAKFAACGCPDMAGEVMGSGRRRGFNHLPLTLLLSVTFMWMTFVEAALDSRMELILRLHLSVLFFRS